MESIRKSSRTDIKPKRAGSKFILDLECINGYKTAKRNSLDLEQMLESDLGFDFFNIVKCYLQ